MKGKGQKSVVIERQTFGHEIKAVRSISDLDPHVKVGQILCTSKGLKSSLVFQSREFFDEVVLCLELLFCTDDSVANIPSHMADNNSDILLRELELTRHGILAFINRGRERIVNLEH